MLERGEAEAHVALIDGASRATTLSFRSPARLFAPRVTKDSAWIIGSTLGGGLVTGDQASTRLVVENGARALYTTLGSTKVYKGSASQVLDVVVDDGAFAAVVPDPLVPFRRATIEQTAKLRVAAQGSLVFLDVISSGRLRFDERWAFTRLRSRLSFERDGRQIGDETTLLDEQHGNVAARAGRFEAIGTLLFVGPLVAEHAENVERTIASTRPRKRDSVIEAASRLSDGSLLVRSVADDEQALVLQMRQHLAFLSRLLGDDPFARRGL